MSTQIQEGDKVSWNWNGSHPSGTASEVKPGEVTVTSHRGNDISKTGDESNPAVHISRSGNDVVKTANELKVESKGESNGPSTEESNGNGAPAKSEEKKEPEEAHTGEKRTVDEKPSADDAEEKPEDPDADAKKQKTGTDAKTNGTNGEKKKAGPGRPKNSSGPKKEKKAPT
ncbi:hypothetical protein LAWI1_G007656, partial [Lachnellula willkommii]